MATTKTTKTPGRAKGALVLAEQMSVQERKDRAARAAAARWGSKPLTATHKGTFKDEFGLDVECYVVNDVTKTPVISQIGMARALGFAAVRGSAFPRFITSKTMAPYVGAELAEKLEKVLIFQWGTAGAGQQPATPIYGYDAALLIDVCQAILKAHADGALKAAHSTVAKQAALIVGSSAKSGIRGLVYALAGYNPSSEEIVAAFKTYIKEEAKKYEQEFPQEMYLAWHRLYSIPIPVRGKPWHFKHLTLRHIYYPLAKSNGKILDLLKAEKAKDGDRQKKLFQFLSEIGTRALRMHIGRVLEMAESSVSESEYERKIAERFGGQQELELVVPS